MIRSVNIVKNTRKYKYLFVKKIGLILIAMTAGFVFCVYTRLRLVRTSFTYCYQTVPMDFICGYFYSKYDKKLFHMQSKMYINIWFFFLLVEVKLSKYADIQFVESETVMNYISFSSVLWRISMLVKFIIYYLAKTYWRFTSNFQVITFPRRIKW